MAGSGNSFRDEIVSAHLPAWHEIRFVPEIVALRRSPVFRGEGIPRGEGAAVILFPGFLMPDLYLTTMYRWLKRIGYRPYFSGIGINADCPNLLIEERLSRTLNRARSESNRQVHLIGHSLGGVIARSMASQRPDDVASVITLASPFKGISAHGFLLTASKAVRWRIFRKRGAAVLAACYTGNCTCEFVKALRSGVPDSVQQTAIYTRDDGLVDWRCCITGDPEIDVEVAGTHIGLTFNAAVYRVVSERLAKSR